MCKEDDLTPATGLPFSCCGGHTEADQRLMELGFQIVYTRLRAAESSLLTKDETMPARAA
ncbi:hypothetical protein E4L96_14205 [Massilia arenosa]|uniref:Uncharacterized protein n=1 Tax=Zemynaea arenosa TaxID=2561931 RepID=A0A4Y9S7Q9_9BURK|nr:hypothetical protein [Massilia arenosa]TFW17587.1 hypothetical protein E4L96_14205 [Massilia arenosa]